ncbi:Inherit from COG: Retrotransposon protein [Seminavis robusta]|uniref:Inherit from COG: Retrotransposon protein n=1 Tax=Seminavis robusta TaxID=568900 RepID=A0A9N8DVK0_9STRA|nr:Inherit from COG: Retrotransposon protein [Seminavis robusta]|eukprot:Sro326_g117930.1 Inherit from COG: Retrotransposon protein (262) ;mRNA; r:1240-2025
MPFLVLLNLTHKLSAFQTQRVMRWRLLLEEFGPTFHYKPGPQNVLGDALSRVPTAREDRDSADSDPLSTSTDGCYSIVEENRRLAECLMHHPDDGMEESFLEHPTFDGEGRNPFNFSVLAEYQAASAVLQQTVVDNPERFFKKMFGNSELICFRQNDEDKIVLTKELLPKLVSFYHKSMAHVEGMDRLEQTIKTHFYHRGIRDEVRKQIEQCEACAKHVRRTNEHDMLMENLLHVMLRRCPGKKSIVTQSVRGRLSYDNER